MYVFSYIYIYMPKSQIYWVIKSYEPSSRGRCTYIM